MRKIITYIATSADGYIARKDGGVDWLDRAADPAGYGMAEFYVTIDTILWGRKTYDFGVGMGAEFDTDVKNYVFSRRRPPASVPDGVEFTDEAVRAFADRLRAEPGKDIWMMGGGELIASFLDEDRIDAFIIHVIPVLIGDGIPLIAPRHRTVPLSLRSTRAFDDGVVRLHYEVERS